MWYCDDKTKFVEMIYILFLLGFDISNENLLLGFECQEFFQMVLITVARDMFFL